MRIFRSKKRLAALLSVGLVTGVALTAIAHAAVTFGPSRPTFTGAHPANYITFNSITDNPNWGDERYLLKARDINSPTTAYATSTQVKDGETVVLSVYFHNNAASSLNLTATNTRVKIALPGTTGNTVTPTGYISADNANPTQVFSTADLTSSNPFSITYEAGSAKLYTNKVNGGTLSDDVVGNGTLVGTNGADGKVPGCSEFSGYVTVRVKVHTVTQPQPKFECKALDVNQIDRTRFDFTAKASVENVTVKSYNFVATDKDGKTVDSATVNTSDLSAVYHFNQSTPGKYIVGVVITTDHGSTKIGDCSKQVEVTEEGKPPVPPTTPPSSTPAELPNTGAGGVAALFAGASGLGTAGHMILSRRRQS